jgi:NADH-quinone oxidoreductase subunit I
MKQYLKNSFDGIWTVLVGMKVTFKHLFKPSVTIQYPDVKLPMADRVRNRLYVNMDDCIGCDQCARACPVDCITIDTVKSLPNEDLGVTSNGKKKALWVTKFDIDIAKCCYCQLCVFPCPTECIYMTDVYEFSEFERDNLNYKFATLTESEVEEKKANFEKMQVEKEAKKAEAAKAKAEALAKKKAEEEAKAKEEPKKDDSDNKEQPDKE